MNIPPYDFEPDEEAGSQLDTVLMAAASQLLNHVTADAFLNWAKTSLPLLAPAFFTHIPPSDVGKIAFWLGVNIWNNAPQPDYGFKPVPLDKPKRNTPCPCGSGLKYKQCCIQLQHLPDINGDMMWPFFCEVSSKSEINKMLQSGDVPVAGHMLMAEFYFDRDDFAQVIKILEPLFAGKAPRITQKHSGALDMLCDAYNEHYKTDKKKQDLLQRMTQHSNSTIRAEAWQRLASSRQDAGDITGARSALSEAMRAEPDNPSHCMLELILLVDSNEIELARQRAKFWLRKMRRYQDEYPDVIDILTLAQTDPHKALQRTTSNNDARLGQLMDWINNLKARDIPSYQIGKDKDSQLFENTMSKLGIDQENSENMQADLFDHADDEPEPDEFDPVVVHGCTVNEPKDGMENACTIDPPETIQSLEQAWQDITPIEKPFSTQTEPFGNNDTWLDGHDNEWDDEWLTFLLNNPESADSLDILDDIATLIYIHPDNNYPWGPVNQLDPLLERAMHIIEKATVGENINLTWLIMENRPALRLLTGNIYMAMDNQQQEKAIHLMQQYIALNPGDNHGFRSLLINHYLQQKQDQLALELANHYPQDIMAETIYGKILALYRLDKIDQAENTLRLAYEQLPLVADYLLKARVKQGNLDEDGYIYGGEDQAWIYRDDMRETWQASTGAMKWLKSTLRKIQA